MVNLYHYQFNVVYTDPMSGQENVADVQLNVSKRALEEFTAETIAHDYVGRYLFSQYLMNLLPDDRKDATVLKFSRNSVELEHMKQKLHELDICEYQYWLFNF